MLNEWILIKYISKPVDWLEAKIVKTYNGDLEQRGLEGESLFRKQERLFVWYVIVDVEEYFKRTWELNFFHFS